MPTVDVAPIYSDAWTKQHYEGMARLILRTPDTAEKTIAGVTCQHWCVRFFFTEISMPRWVDVAEITTWQDTEDLILGLHGAEGNADFIWDYTCLRLEATTPEGTTRGRSLSPRPISVERVIVGIGCHYVINTTCHADSFVRMRLWCYTSTNPTAGYSTLADVQTSDQTNSYDEYYHALAASHTVAEGNSFSLSLSLHAVEDGVQNGYVYIKSPFLRLERNI